MSTVSMRAPVIIPADTAIRVRTLDRIDANSAQPGARFRGSLADSLKSSSGAVVIPRKASVQLIVANLKESNRISGREKIDLKVNAVMFNGKSYPVATTTARSQGSGKGSRTLRKTGLSAGTGALIGGITGGGPGAAVGALVGTRGGTAMAAATGGEHLKIPPETVLTVRLHSALRIE